MLGGQRRIPVSKELSESSDANAVLRAGTEVVILRASLKRAGDKFDRQNLFYEILRGQ